MIFKNHTKENEILIKDSNGDVVAFSSHKNLHDSLLSLYMRLLTSKYVHIEYSDVFSLINWLCKTFGFSEKIGECPYCKSKFKPEIDTPEEVQTLEVQEDG